MRYLNSILGRYVLKALIPPFLVNLTFLIFVFLMAKLIKITNLMVNYQVDLVTIVELILYTMPTFLEFVLPMAVMTTVLLTFLRMSGDNEFIALKAGGVSPWALFPMVVFFCLLTAALTAVISLWALPESRTGLKRVGREMVTGNIGIGIEERTFNNTFDGITMYISRVVPPGKQLEDVFIEDRRRQDMATTIIAPEGVLFKNDTNGATYLRLYDGTLNQVDRQGRTASVVKFSTYDVKLDLKAKAGEQVVARKKKSRKEMGLFELWAYLQQVRVKGPAYYPFLLTFHQKIAFPFSCLALGILAAPLGLMAGGNRRKSVGLSLGVLFFLFYYILLSAGIVFGESGAYPPLLAMWIPNIVMGCIGIYLYHRVAQDQAPQLPDPEVLMLRLRGFLSSREKTAVKTDRLSGQER